MILELAQKLRETNPNLEIYKNYSGRFMFGTTTTAIVGSKEELSKAITEVNSSFDYSWDELGKQHIIY